MFLLTYAQQAQAGLFSDFWKFFAGSEADVEASSAAAISLPLLGSQSVSAYWQGSTGGPSENSVLPLPTVQDSALVASRNPIGTISPANLDQIVVYTVQSGDTPSLIANNFGISLNTLLWANNIRSAGLIKVGDELVVLPVSGVKYEVKKGDTIESIAKSFRGDSGEILSFNGLAVGEPLEVGATIIIPDGELIPAPSSPSSDPKAASRFANLRVERAGYYIRPILGGRKSRGIHGYNGIDLATGCGQPLLASAGGIIILARSSGWNGGYGRYVVLVHDNRTQTLYAHMSAIFASVGQKVAQGSQIGTVGSTGNSTGCHVHFEIRGAKNPF